MKRLSMLIMLIVLLPLVWLPVMVMADEAEEGYAAGTAYMREGR